MDLIALSSALPLLQAGMVGTVLLEFGPSCRWVRQHAFVGAEARGDLVIALARKLLVTIQAMTTPGYEIRILRGNVGRHRLRGEVREGDPSFPYAGGFTVIKTATDIESMLKRVSVVDHGNVQKCVGELELWLVRKTV